MTTKTNLDWNFSTYVHQNLALPIIYNSLGWKKLMIDETTAIYQDINEGIDYVFEDTQKRIITVQERFRDNYYVGYNDATLRYRRDFNPDPTRIESEFYKIKADYLVYGITNGKKFPDKRHTVTDFSKWVILDLKFLREKFSHNQIKILTPSAMKTCRIENTILISPEVFNKDDSSSFLPFDISMMKSLWGDKTFLAQKGFLPQNK